MNVDCSMVSVVVFDKIRLTVFAKTMANMYPIIPRAFSLCAILYNAFIFSSLRLEEVCGLQEDEGYSVLIFLLLGLGLVMIVVLLGLIETQC